MIAPSNANFRKDFDKYVNKALLLIHDQQTRDAVLTSLKGNDPVQKVATATVMVMQRVDLEARKSNLEVQDSVKVLSATKIVNEMIILDKAAGIVDLTNKDLTELALSVAIQDYVKAEIKAGRMNAQKVKVALERDVRSLPPNLRKEAQVAPARIQQTARRYSHGQGIAQFPPAKQGGV